MDSKVRQRLSLWRRDRGPSQPLWMRLSKGSFLQLPPTRGTVGCSDTGSRESGTILGSTAVP